jgi:membrane-associated phospholipid phosphatase
MALTAAPQHASADSSPSGVSRQTIVGFAGALLFIAALVAFVDGPLAQALARLPDGAIRVFAIPAAYLKGVYLIALALAVCVGAMLASAFSGGSTRFTLRSVSVAAGYVFAATLIALVLATVLKIAIGRARPELMAIEGPHAFFPFSTGKAYTSFPSGETMMAVAFFGAWARLAVARAGFAIAALMFAPALFLATGRIVVGAHYLSDVVAAALLALAIVAWLYAALEQHIAGKLTEPA